MMSDASSGSQELEVNTREHEKKPEEIPEKKGPRGEPIDSNIFDQTTDSLKVGQWMKRVKKEEGERRDERKEIRRRMKQREATYLRASRVEQG
jgi:hypothetical protein